MGKRFDSVLKMVADCSEDPEFVAELGDKIAAKYRRENERLRKALEAIREHQEFNMKGAHHLSATWRIADRALREGGE